MFSLKKALRNCITFNRKLNQTQFTIVDEPIDVNFRYSSSKATFLESEI